jgi:hypothetical protein
MSIAKGDKCCATCSSKKDNPQCPRDAAVVYDKKKYCKQHAKQAGWVDAKDIPEVKKNPTPEDKPNTTKKPAENIVVMPAETKGLGTCNGTKAGGKGACTNAAKLCCPDTCSCKGEAYCKIHWKTAHKGKVLSDGKGNISSGRKPVDEDKQCECEKKSGGGGQCGKPAFGTNAEGKRACHTHGGPKKGDLAGSGPSSSSGGAVNTGGTGAFAGINWPRLFTRVLNLKVEWALDETEANAETEAIQWLCELIEMHATGTPTTESLIAHFAKSAWSKKTGKEYAEVYKHTMFFVLRDLLGEVDTNWLARMYSNLGKEAGAEAAEVGVIWIATAKECGLPVSSTGVTSSATGSSTKGAAVLTSDRKPKVKALIEKARAEKAKEEAAQKGKAEKGKEEDKVPVAEEPTEVEEDNESPINMDVEDEAFVVDEEDNDEDSLSVDEDDKIKFPPKKVVMDDDDGFVQSDDE